MVLIFETERLICKPLKINDFHNAIYKSDQFIKDFSSPFPKSAYYGEDNFKKIASYIYMKAKSDEKNYYWFTPWIITLKKNHKIIGIVNLKGPMTDDKEVTIGYGIEPEYRGKGYASETIKGIMRWVKEHSNPKRIIAFTAKDNKKSHIVLRNNHFIIYNEIENEFVWKYEF